MFESPITRARMLQEHHRRQCIGSSKRMFESPNTQPLWLQQHHRRQCVGSSKSMFESTRVKFISGVQNQISAHFHSFTKFLTFQSLLMFETILISCSTIYTNHFTCLYNNVALPLFVKSHFQCSIFFVHICCS